MKLPIFILVFFFSLTAISQNKPIKTVSKPMNGKVKIYAVNGTPFVHSIKIKKKGTGCKPSKKLPVTLVLQPNSEVEVFDLLPIKNQKWKCGTTYNYVVGDIMATPNKTFTYDLPFKKGETYRISQGYNGSFSHKKKFALDFTMPVGTPIHAIRAGRVVKMKMDSDTGCPDIKCVKQANYIWIEHKDGTIAEYAHLRMNGTSLKLGDYVEKGDQIALSGNTGFSQGPHLHLEIFIQTIDGKRKTIATKFKVNGKVAKSLRKGTDCLNAI